MKFHPEIALLAFAILFASGCQQLPVKKEIETSHAEDAHVQAKPLPFEERKPSLKELDSEVILDYLAAEIGAQRGQLTDAYEHYIQAATKTGDSFAAKRAAQIALHLNQAQMALRAGRLWVELEPNSIDARLLTGLLLLSEGQPQLAKKQFLALLKITDATGDEGFLIIAKGLLDENLQADSVNVMRSLVETNPGSARAHYALAVVEIGAKLFPDALDSLRTASSIQPDWDQPRILEGKILLSTGQEPEALAALQAGIKAAPDSLALRMAYSRLLIRQQDYPGALASLEDARKLAPEDAEVLTAIGLIQLELKQLNDARSTWQQLRGVHSAHGQATYYLAQTEEMDNRPEIAMGLYASIKNGEFASKAQLQLAKLMIDSGRIQEGRDLFRELRVLSPETANDIYALEARALLKQGEKDAAFELFQSALDLDPDNVDLRYNRGIIASENDRLELAIADFQYILKQNPDHADTLNALGYTLADQTDRYEEALIYVLKANRLKPESPAIQDSLGWAYYRLGNMDLALKFLKMANAQINDGEIAAHLGEVLWASGEHEEAKKIWKEALAREPENQKLLEVMQRLK